MSDMQREERVINIYLFILIIMDFNIFRPGHIKKHIQNA